MKVHQNKNGDYWTQIYVGKKNEKRLYKKIHARSKHELEVKVLEEKLKLKRQLNPCDMTLREGCTLYIELKKGILSDTTLRRYEQYRADAFQDIMDMRMDEITGYVLERSVAMEANRKPRRSKNNTMAPRTLKNEYGFIRSVLQKYTPHVERAPVRLKKIPRTYPPLIPPEDIIRAVKGSDIELPVLLSMWLSLTVSEIRGLTKSKSLDGNYLTVREVLVTVNGKDIRKDMAKEVTRNRRFKIPPYIMNLIEALPKDQDIIVPLSHSSLYEKWKRALHVAGLPHVSFHELRHECASIMARLRIPTKTACEIGGWATPLVMQSVYTQVFDDDRIEADEKMNSFFEDILN